MSSKRSRQDDSSDESSDGEEEEEPILAATSAAGGGGVDSTRLEQLKREKRLAMNRESARARRRRKKFRLETLEQHAEELSQRHHNLVLNNQQLKTRVAQLEADLASFGANRAAAVGAGGMDPSRILGGHGLGAGVGLGGGSSGQDVASFAASANLGRSAEQRSLQQQAVMARIGGGGSGAFAGLGIAGMDPEMQYLQMQQQLLASTQGSDGATSATSGSSAAARLMALERRNQLAALRGGVPDVDAILNQVSASSDTNSGLKRLKRPLVSDQVPSALHSQHQTPGLRRLDDLSRIRGAEGLRGAFDLGLAPVDASARLREQQATARDPQGGAAGGTRDVKELYDRLANTNKKFPNA